MPTAHMPKVAIVLIGTNDLFAEADCLANNETQLENAVNGIYQRCARCIRSAWQDIKAHADGLDLHSSRSILRKPGTCTIQNCVSNNTAYNEERVAIFLLCRHEPYFVALQI